jgi:inhibitor of cysteine peptidase
MSDSVTVTAQENGKTVSLAPDGTLLVRLDAQAGTGFRWQPDPDSTALLTLEKTEYEGATRLPGARATEVITFRAAQPGHGALKLSWRRAWQEGIPPAKTFTLAVTVAL